MRELLLEAKKIVKTFPGTKALSEVDIDVSKGEIVALVGENGAGKSTLTKIIAGVYQPDLGNIFLEGQEVTMVDPLRSQELGIALVHQELSLFPKLSVAENIFANRQPTKMGLLDKSTLFVEAKKLLDEFKVNIDVRKEAGSLSISAQQIVEVVKALSLKPKVLILDEPTSALSQGEIDQLFILLNNLKKYGIGIIYISHKLKEIFTIADRVVVLRDGYLTGNVNIAETTEDDIIKMMVGRESYFVFPKKSSYVEKKTLLEVRKVNVPGKVENVSFKLNRGEILGIFGLMGAGRTEAARAIYGLEGTSELYINDERIVVRSPFDAMKHGIVYLSEDRKLDGIFPEMAVTDNIIIGILKKLSKYGIFLEASSRKIAAEMVKAFRIKIAGLNQKVEYLSGGNQQKVLLARFFKCNPKVLIADEPTRGIDVGAKSEIHRFLRKLADEGMPVAVISSELPEIIGLSDRILVMCQGRITGDLIGEQMHEEKIMACATSFKINGKGV